MLDHKRESFLEDQTGREFNIHDEYPKGSVGSGLGLPGAYLDSKYPELAWKNCQVN